MAEIKLNVGCMTAARLAIGKRLFDATNDQTFAGGTDAPARHCLGVALKSDDAGVVPRGPNHNNWPHFPIYRLSAAGVLRISRSALSDLVSNPNAPAEIQAAARDLVSRIDESTQADRLPGPIRRAFTGPACCVRAYQNATEFVVDGMELRVDDDDGSGTGATLTGYAAVFDTLSEPLFFGLERIQRGAFARSIRERADVVANVEHEGGLNVLARTTNHTLRMVEDTHGLKVWIDVADTNAGRDVVELVRRGDLYQMSFAFRVVKQELDDSGDEMIRTLTDVDLFDVSVVAVPAYRDTSVEANSAAHKAAKRSDDPEPGNTPEPEGTTNTTTADPPEPVGQTTKPRGEFGRRLDSLDLAGRGA